MDWTIFVKLIRSSRGTISSRRVVYLLLFLAGVLVVWSLYAQLWLQLSPTSPQNLVGILLMLVIVAGGILYSDRMVRRHDHHSRRKQKFSEWYARQELELETDRSQEVTFQTYMDRMTGLLVENGLGTADPGTEVRHIARARTLGVLPSLDGAHKGILLRFMYDSNLISRPQAVLDLCEADLRGVIASQANLGGIDLRETDLSAADLSGTDLNQADLRRTALIVANLTSANLVKADLREASLTEAVLTAAKLNEANLDDADLHGANLEGVEMIGSSLLRADLRDCILTVANLVEANLQGANLRGANLEGTDLINANLEEADLTGANLRGVVLRGVKYNKMTKWPKGMMPSPTGVVVVE